LASSGLIQPRCAAARLARPQHGHARGGVGGDLDDGAVEVRQTFMK